MNKFNDEECIEVFGGRGGFGGPDVKEGRSSTNGEED